MEGFRMALSKSAATSVAALSIFMTGAPALADVTPGEVWGDWKDYMAGFGYEVSSSESMSGGTLTVSDIEMAMTLPEDEGRLTMTMDEMTFSDNGDGTVSVSIPPVMPLNVSVDTDKGEDVDVQIEYTTKGFSMNVSGDADAMTYIYAAAEVAIDLRDLVVDGENVDLGTINVLMKNLTGTTEMTMGDIRQSRQTMNSGEVSYDINVADPEGSGQFMMNGAFDGMSFDGTGSFPSDMNTEDPAAMFAAGFGFDGGFTYGGGAGKFMFQEHGDVVQGSASSDGGGLEIAMNAGRFAYGGHADGVAMEFSGGDIPFPVELSMDEWRYDLLMPIAKSDDSQDFSLGFKIGNFAMSDMIWGIFDPGGQLPRDPATIALDITGKAKLFFDLMDPAQMQKVETGDEMPGELNELNLNELVVTAAGAELTGAGGFTFDNSDLETFDGVPAPTGSIDLQLVGGNALLDTLIAMGLVPEDQAMGMRMMMGMFAVPGDGEDTLMSTIEVSGDGQIKANGQRIR